MFILNYYFMKINKNLFIFSICCLLGTTSVFGAGVPATPVATGASNFITTGNQSFCANWNLDPNATGYMIDISQSPSFASPYVVLTGIQVSWVGIPPVYTPVPQYNTYRDFNLGNTGNPFATIRVNDFSSTLYYRIRSYNSYGPSAYSNVITVKADNTGMIPNGIFAMRAQAGGAFLTASTSSLGKVTNPTTMNGDFSKWSFWHLGNNIYEIRSVGLNERMEDPYGDDDGINDIAITNWGGIQPHIKWQAVKVGNCFMFIPQHKTTYALDANYGYGSVVHLWAKDQNNANQLFYVIKSWAPSAPSASSGSVNTDGTIKANWSSTNNSDVKGYYLDASTTSDFSSIISIFTCSYYPGGWDPVLGNYPPSPIYDTYSNKNVGNVTTSNINWIPCTFHGPLTSTPTVYYRVRAFNDYGTSPYSNVIKVAGTTVSIMKSPKETTPVDEVSQNDEVSKLQIVPNPAKEFATVTWSGDESDVTLSIFDLSGKQVFGTSVGGSSYQLNTSELSNGVYILKLTSASGTQTSKLVVQK
jgi:Secretion system C-terminal sorting domain